MGAPKPGHVYVMDDGGKRTRIGRSKNVGVRIQQIRIDYNAEPVLRYVSPPLAASNEVEKIAHRIAIEGGWSNKGDWFLFMPVADAIAAVERAIRVQQELEPPLQERRRSPKRQINMRVDDEFLEAIGELQRLLANPRPPSLTETIRFAVKEHVESLKGDA